jgi:hypothetical protein
MSMKLLSSRKGFPGGEGALEWAGIDRGGSPFPMDAFSKRGSLSASNLCQRKVISAAKPLGRQAVHMSMPGEQYLGHIGTPFPPRLQRIAIRKFLVMHFLTAL